MSRTDRRMVFISHLQRELERLAAESPTPGVDNPGVVDGDCLLDLLAEALPPEWSVEACQAWAEKVLGEMARSGYTVLRGAGSQPWQPDGGG